MSNLARQSGTADWGRILRGIGLALIAGGVGLVCGSRAEAQRITVRQVVGRADPGASDRQFPDIKEAITRLGNRDVKGARLLLKEAKSKNPKLPPPEMMMANILITANQSLSTVRAELEDCVKNNPADPEAYLVLGDQAFSEGRTTDAEVLFARAQQLAADFKENAARQRDCQIRADAGLAAVAERREQWELAKNYLGAWLAFYGADPDPASAPAHDRLGRVLFKADTSTTPPLKSAGAHQALKQFEAAVENDEKSISADLALALMYEDEAKLKEKDSPEYKQLHGMAQHFITLAVDKPPKDPATRMSTMLAAARWAIDTEQAAEAVTYADMALAVDSKSLEAKYLKGVASRLAKDIKTAEKCLDEVYFISPSNFAAANQLAQVLAEQQTDKEKQRRALEMAEINNRVAVQDRQNQGQALESATTLGWVLYLMGRNIEAANVMQQVVNTGTVSADGLYYIARLNDDQGKRKEAIQLLTAALENGRQFVHRREAERMLASFQPASEKAKPDTDNPEPPKKSGSDADKPSTVNPVKKTAP